MSVNEKSPIGYLLEVDLEYSANDFEKDFFKLMINQSILFTKKQWKIYEKESM